MLKKLLLRTRLFFRVWLFSHDNHSLLLWAVVAGVLGAWATILFRWGICAVQWSFSGVTGTFPHMARSLPWYVRFIIPALGGVLAGFVLAWVSKYQTKDDHTEYIETVAMGDGNVPIRLSLMRSLSSLLTIGSGGSIGRESLMVQLSALAASLWGRFLRLDANRLRLLVACGGAAGVTAAYNAPIAGSIFICEIVLGSIAVESFGPVVISAVVSNVVMHEFAGYQPPYIMPVFPAVTGPQILLFLLMGCMCGVLGPFFIHLLRFSKKQFQRTKLPFPLRLGLGGLGVGVISIWTPDVWGNGYSVVNSVLHTKWAWEMLLIVLLCKLVATALTAGSGALGGTFTPTLFVGALFGSLYGLVVHYFFPSSSMAAPHAFAIVSMGAALTGATQAPLMAILMIFEMTMSYQVMLPLMSACVVAYFVSRIFGPSAMYDVIKHRQENEQSKIELLKQTMANIMESTQTVVLPTASEEEMMRLFINGPFKYLYVVDEQDIYHGEVALKSVSQKLWNTKQEKNLVAKDFCQHQLPMLKPDMRLEDALGIFLQFKGERLPVVDHNEPPTFLGVVFKSTLLDVYKKVASDHHAAA